MNSDRFISRCYLGMFGEGRQKGNIGKSCLSGRKTTVDPWTTRGSIHVYFIVRSSACLDSINHRLGYWKISGVNGPSQFKLHRSGVNWYIVCQVIPSLTAFWWQPWSSVGLVIIYWVFWIKLLKANGLKSCPKRTQELVLWRFVALQWWVPIWIYSGLKRVVVCLCKGICQEIGFEF